ncbi:MAG TPA: hypothetical protein VFQ57_10115 [Sphingomonas sp.]|jgi:uncharacterized integral membrane protein|nr:hypothetical protein [Sphingomonas sp.]
MQFLKILFWCLLAFLAAVFTVGNWNRVEIHLWSDITALVNLPLLLLATFLAGLLPAVIYHYAARWRWRSRLQALERAMPPVLPPATPMMVSEPDVVPAPVHPATPVIVPPADA